MSKPQNTFSQFTNQYELSKTLRFELKPVDNTEQMLKNAKIFKTDELIQEKYKQTKPFFDRLHRGFVKEALANVYLSELQEYQEALKIWQKDKKAKIAIKNLERQEKLLREQVGTFFDAQAKEYAENYTHLSLKKKDVNLLFEEGIFGILKENYDDKEGSKIINKTTGEIVSIFDSWKGFNGYFTKFFETRKNFYKDDGKAGRIATRIVNQNLKRFCDNLEIFQRIKEKLDFAEVEENFGKSMNEIFSLSFYNQCLLQDGIDAYNDILGGKTLENGEKLKGVNELINKYRQDNKGEKLPFLKKLDKQILSEKEKFIDEIETDEELESKLREFHKAAQNKTKIIRNLFSDFVKNNEKYNLSEIYISKEAFNTISHKWTGETRVFEEKLFECMKSDKPTGLKYEKKDDSYKFPDFIALSYIKLALENTLKDIRFWKERYYLNEENEEDKGFLLDNEETWNQFLQIFNFEFNGLFEREILDKKTNAKISIGYDIYEKEFSKLLEGFKLNKDSKLIIKDFADSSLRIYQMAKYFAVEKKRAWRDEYDLDIFYTDPDNGYLKFYENAYEDIVQVYNKLRNYLTKKPYSTQKWKLNFQNSTLADGWDKNKEADNFAVILRKDGKYFLGLMRKGANKLFTEKYEMEFSQHLEKGKYEKMVYKFFPDQAKMFPKVCFSAKGLDFFKPSKEIYNIYKNAEFKKGDTFSVESMQKLINFYKDCLTKYEGWQCYKFKNVKPTKAYTENISKFYADVAKNGYKISFQDISEEYINLKNQNSELYLFEIHNKDWNLKDGKKKAGTKNLHTMYFENLFSQENIDKNFVFKLNGQAEIFYRPKTKEDKLEYKKDNKGNEVIDHKRYAEDKIFFHVPMKLNRGKSLFNFNAKLNNDILANDPDINIIGVDRGEKHLAYYSVINQQQKILDSGTLNVVKGGDGKEIDYHQKLEDKAKDREQARKDWQEVEGIKDLKKGYISQVVHKLADLAIEYNAIIVFEDLNMRFKQIRGGIEKSVYQQLEKALIDKLSFLVQKKEINSQKAGHLLKAYQLAAPFESFQKMGKQTGIIFYTQASYTSKIDPLTGWRPNLYLKSGSAEKNKENILKFSKIEFVNDRFEFSYDLKNFGSKKDKSKKFPENTEWTLCSSVERYRWNRKLNNNKGGYDYYKNLTDDFKALFEEYDIDMNRGDILGQIDILETKGNEKFFSSFIFLWSLVCQIRNTNSDVASGDSDNDFILSPVEPFFDSRKSENFGESLPENGDDNGAFNIARKGIVILDKIADYQKQNGNCDKLGWGNLYVSHIDWDNFAQNR